MAAVAGVTKKKNLQGKFTHASEGVRKHKKAISMIEKIKPIKKTPFQVECEGAISVEEFRTRVHKRLKELWDSK